VEYGHACELDVLLPFLRLVTGRAIPDRTVLFAGCRQLLMTGSTELMETRLGPHCKRAATTTMANNTGKLATPINVVVMAGDARDIEMVVVREIDR